MFLQCVVCERLEQNFTTSRDLLCHGYYFPKGISGNIIYGKCHDRHMGCYNKVRGVSQVKTRIERTANKRNGWNV